MKKNTNYSGLLCDGNAVFCHFCVFCSCVFLGLPGLYVIVSWYLKQHVPTTAALYKKKKRANDCVSSTFNPLQGHADTRQPCLERGNLQRGKGVGEGVEVAWKGSAAALTSVCVCVCKCERIIKQGRQMSLVRRLEVRWDKSVCL